MKKRGFLGLDYIAWIILGAITLAIVLASLGYFGRSGSGGLAEIYNNWFRR